MRTTTRAAMAALAGAASAAAAQPGSLSTIFASNNNGSPGGGIYFSITVGPSPIEITSLETNTSIVGGFTMDVYTREGGFSGFETNIGNWTLRANGNGNGTGLNTPSPVTLSANIPLDANTVYGVALDMDATASHHYTNGTGLNQQYSNADITINTGTATNVAFTAPIFTPRVWNGTVKYNVVSACYPDCDTSTGVGNLDIFDFLCFQNLYDAGSPYACDCDQSTGPGVCDIFDFLCFQNAYDAGCP